jgi:hypothetical protein
MIQIHNCLGEEEGSCTDDTKESDKVKMGDSRNICSTLETILYRQQTNELKRKNKMCQREKEKARSTPMKCVFEEREKKSC